MADHFRSEVGKHLLESDGITDVALEESGCGRDIFPPAAAEVVNHSHCPAECDGLLSDMTANESCSARNQKSHGSLPVLD